MVASSEDNFTVTELNCFSDLINLVTLGYGFSFLGYTQFSLSKGLSGKSNTKIMFSMDISKK